MLNVNSLGRLPFLFQVCLMWIKKENILEGCLPPACQPYVLRWLVLRWWPPDATGRGIPYLMSGGGNRVPCLMSRGWPGAFLYREVKYIMDNDHIATPCGQTDWQKDTTENISLAGGKNVIVFINGYGFLVSFMTATEVRSTHPTVLHYCSRMSHDCMFLCPTR